jgi:hypothetical protein
MWLGGGVDGGDFAMLPLALMLPSVFTVTYKNFVLLAPSAAWHL